MNWGRSKRDTVTIIVEDDHGEPVDMQAVADALRPLGLKMRTWVNGDHTLARSCIRRAAEQYEAALSLLGELDEEEAPDATP